MASFIAWYYYPFGLTMAGISSKAAGGIQNKYKFNGGNELQSAEFSDGSGMELYDAVHRMYDPQLGRFWQVDELAEANWEMSTYCFASDNPLRFNDPLGLTDADPKDDPTGDMKKTKTLSEVVVSSKIPKLNNDQISHLYWALQNYGRGTDRIRNKTWRAQVEAYDATAKWLVKYHAGVKEDGMMMLDIASNFIPLGWVTKLRYVKYAANLFKFKRAIAVEKTAAKYLYHYTTKEAAESISQQGLKVGKDGFSYLTNNGGLSPLQAQIELALPANRVLPNSILRIDASGLDAAIMRRVTGNMPGYGAGGGTEFLFNQQIPAHLIEIVK